MTSLPTSTSGRHKGASKTVSDPTRDLTRRRRGIPCTHHPLAVRLDIALNVGTRTPYHERQELLADIAGALVAVDHAALKEAQR